MVNVACVGKGVSRKTIPANSRVRVATLSKRKAGGPIMFKHSFSYAMLFSPEPDQPDSVSVEGPAYSLPWQGGPFRISQGAGEIGRASCRERVCPSVLISVGALSLKTTKLTSSY